MANTRSFKPKLSSSESTLIDRTAVQPADILVSNTSPVQAMPNTYSADELVGESGREDGGRGYSRGYSRESSPRSFTRDVPTEEVSGFLDIMPEGHGFLRPKYTHSDKDVYISASQIRRFNLRPG